MGSFTLFPVKFFIFKFFTSFHEFFSTVFDRFKINKTAMNFEAQLFLKSRNSAKNQNDVNFHSFFFFDLKSKIKVFSKNSKIHTVKVGSFQIISSWSYFSIFCFLSWLEFQKQRSKTSQNSHFTAKRVKMDRKILGSIPSMRLNSNDLDTPTETGFNPRASSTSSKPRKFFPSAADNLDNIFKKTLDISTKLQRYPSVILVIDFFEFKFPNSFYLILGWEW